MKKQYRKYPRKIGRFFINLMFFLIIFCFIQGCHHAESNDNNIIPGAYRLKKYLPQIKNKDIGVVANHTSFIGEVHLVDSLINLDVQVLKIFSPEHGFRGEAEAGEKWTDHKDKKTGLPIISLYGNHRKPTIEDMNGLDVVLFDIQDVGVRFYTYISTLHYVMESCAENNVRLIILDRPNPNGFYIDGPVLNPAHRSFVGMHPVPLVYGMTIGEYAGMINGEGWLKDKAQCDLTVIPCKNYHHHSKYHLPIKPSPNLKNMRAVYLYPSLGLFEGTVISVGRGTSHPFQILGHPDYPDTSFSFMPRSIDGESRNPKHKQHQCYGVDLTSLSVQELSNKSEINLEWLLHFYRKVGSKEPFFNAFFTNLSGTEKLKKQVESGKTEDEIRNSWQKELNAFKEMRTKYLLY